MILKKRTLVFKPKKEKKKKEGGKEDMYQTTPF